MTTRPDDDALAFSEDTETSAPTDTPADGPCWTVLTVDDDPGVYQVTRLALRGMRFDGLPITLLHAASAAEARYVLMSGTGPSLLLLDVG
jgi:hypothetical protein